MNQVRPRPSSWSVSEVLRWGTDEARLSRETLRSLSENEVDGATLISLTKSEIKEDLEIHSLAARRFLFDLIQTLRDEDETCEFAVAVDIHDQEIRRFASLKLASSYQSPDAASGGEIPSQSAIVEELSSDVERQRLVITDHLLACRIQRDMQVGLPEYEGMEVAREEQRRLNALLEQEQQDRAYAESLASGTERARLFRQKQAATRENEKSSLPLFRGRAKTPTEDRVASLFGLSVQACATNKINVAEAFRSGKIRPIQPALSLSDDTDDSLGDGSKDEADMDQKPAAMPRGLFNLPYIEQCNTCFDENIRGYHLACGHLQCISCTRKLFQAGLKDSSLLPLRCCEVPIDMNIATDLLKKAEATAIVSRVEEIEAVNKMYCPTCNSFLNLDLVDSSQSSNFVCSCGVNICISCKTLAHFGTSCRRNLLSHRGSDDLVLELSRTNGWKQCPSCSSMIELRSGCNHMTCSFCRHEFCFRCLSKWNSRTAQCSSGRCELWEEDRLLEAGEARVQQEEAIRGRVFGGEARRQRLRVAVEGLRLNEVCNHDWVHSDGYQGDCPNCSFEMNMYGMRCESDCGSVVCYTCAHHRIPQRGWR